MSSFGNEPLPGNWNYQGPQYDPGRIKEAGWSDPYQYWQSVGGGGNGGSGGIAMAGSGNTTMIDTSNGGVGPLVATVNPATGAVVIGHENSVPVYDFVTPATANSPQQNNLLPILVIGVVAFLLLGK